jgi:UDP-N-acetylmuramoylalanine--D-glutamate ligase
MHAHNIDIVTKTRSFRSKIYMKINKEKVGIWGFGVVGKSVLRFIASPDRDIQILDKNKISAEDQALLDSYQAAYISEDHKIQFLEHNDIIIPSPGINIQAYSAYHHKMITELDLFVSYWKKPLIAVTGTVGKTSVVHLCSSLLNQYGKKIATGGNIGLGMLDLIAEQNQYDLALLELSSFQLEYAHSLAPDIAIITNLFPNHLDRHGSFEQYIKAKANLFMHQKVGQYTIIPLSHKTLIEEYLDTSLLKQNWVYLADKPVTDSQLQDLAHAYVYVLEKEHIVKYYQETRTELCSLSNLVSLSYAQNWLTIGALFDLLQVPITAISHQSVDLPPHRLEYAGKHKEISFYNDSKSTIPEATLQAVRQLSPQSIILLLGGVSKGVDRVPFIEQLPKNIKAIICFGSEADMLAQACRAVPFITSSHKTLEDALQEALHMSTAGDQILLSPAGASFDLYSNYQERGNAFKNLVQKWIADN